MAGGSRPTAAGSASPASARSRGLFSSAGHRTAQQVCAAATSYFHSGTESEAACSGGLGEKPNPELCPTARGLARAPASHQAGPPFPVLLSCARAHAGTLRRRHAEEDTRAPADKGARASTDLHKRADQATSAHPTRAQQPESAPLRAPPLRAPRAPRAHSLGAAAGAPGSRARILQAAPGSGRAAAWRLPAPGKTPAGPSEGGGGRGPSGRGAPQGYLLRRGVWESRDKFDAPRPAATRPPPPRPVRSQKPDAANKSQASRRTAPRAPPSDTN